VSIPQHPLLVRQIRKTGVTIDTLSPELQKLLAAVDDAYYGFDRDHAIVQRNMDWSTAELAHANRELRALLESFPEVLRRFHEYGSQYDYREVMTSYVRELEASRDQIQKQAAMLLQQAEELTEARDGAIEAARLKSEFLANMSHEIRTPLHGTLGMLRLLKNSALNAQQHEYLCLGEESARSLLSVVNDILDFSKVEADKMELEMATFRLRSTLQEVVDTVALKANDAGLELLLEIQPNIPDQVIGDGNRLRQILLNLVGNALKFTASGFVRLIVSSQGVVDRSVTISFAVEDSGIGIPAERRAKIFQAFTQADGSTARKFGGTGLGLAISSRLVQMMGSAIEVSSVVGKGSTFSFVLRLDFEPETAWEEARGDVLAHLANRKMYLLNFSQREEISVRNSLSYWKSELESIDTIAPLSSRDHAVMVDPQAVPVVLVDSSWLHSNSLFEGRDLLDMARQELCQLVILKSIGGVVDLSERTGISIQRRPYSDRGLLGTVLKACGQTQYEWLNRVDSATAIDEVKISSKPLRVLVADDLHVNRVVAMRVLEEMGHTVTLAVDGKNVLGILQNARHFSAKDEKPQPFDILLLDIQMPELDGVETARIIRALESKAEKARPLPIVALTAHALKGDREKFLEAGIDDYLSKPLNVEQLAQILARLSPRGDVGADVASIPRAQQALADIAGLKAQLLLLVSASEFTRSEQLPICDVDQLVGRFSGSQETIVEILSIFLEESSELMDRLGAAISGSEATVTWKAAHALKGSCLNVGGSSCADVASAIEREGRVGRIVIDDSMVDSLGREYLLLREFVTRVIQKLATGPSAELEGNNP
jgi:signal transduction histidine kinase/DNA-binding response OmpR family regulator